MNRRLNKLVWKTQRAAKRTLIVFVTGLIWFLVSPLIFIWGLPQFSVYTQWLSNYGTTTVAVFQIWTVLPEVVLFFIGIFWAGGFFEMIGEHLH